MAKYEIMMKDDIQSHIHTIRNVQVMLDSDLAELYGVETKALNQAVKRNIERFPKEFSFPLTPEENNVLRSQIVTLDGEMNLKSQFVISSWAGRRAAPYVFTDRTAARLEITA
jgi:hypothetical protein